MNNLSFYRFLMKVSKTTSSKKLLLFISEHKFYSESTMIMEAIAGNINITKEVIEKVMNFNLAYMLSVLGRNEACDKETLIKLSYDSYWGARDAVAQNKKTPSYILDILSRDQSNWVRASVAQNPNTSSEVLAELCDDRIISIRDKAKEQLRTRNKNEQA